jgi:SHS2 domain-containing protein
LEAWADSLGELFEALGEALAAQICIAGAGAALERVAVDVTAEDVEELTVEFLSRLLHLFVVGRQVITDVKVDRATLTAIHASVGVEKVALRRHELGPEIKAVTYHQLVVEQQDGQWHGRVLLDL